jgi:hypothetical protein
MTNGCSPRNRIHRESRPLGRSSLCESGCVRIAAATWQLSAYPRTVSEKGTVPSCSEESAKSGQSPTVLGWALTSSSRQQASQVTPHPTLAPPSPDRRRRGSPETSSCSREPGGRSRWQSDHYSNQFNARSRLNAALIRARCVNACGKFPSASPLLPVCSAYRPR